MRALGLTFALVLIAACSKGGGGAPSASGTSGGGTPAAGAPSAAAVEQAQQIFANRCTPCHGPEGMGNGPASAALTPKPRNFHDKTWQGQVNDEHIQKIIQYGGAAVGKSPAMPANPDLGDKPEVIAALKDKIRSFRDQ